MIGSLGGTGMVVGTVVSVVAIVAGGEVITVADPGLFPGSVRVHPLVKTITINNNIKKRKGFFMYSMDLLESLLK